MLNVCFVYVIQRPVKRPTKYETDVGAVEHNENPVPSKAAKKPASAKPAKNAKAKAKAKPNVRILSVHDRVVVLSNCGNFFKIFKWTA